jgi:hypothetical protein
MAHSYALSFPHAGIWHKHQLSTNWVLTSVPSTGDTTGNGQAKPCPVGIDILVGDPDNTQGL